MDGFETQMNRVSDLLEEKMGLTGDDMTGRLRKAARHMPRHVRRRARMLTDSLALAQHPKLRLTLDMPALGSAARVVTQWLESVDPAERRKDLVLGILASLSFNLIAVFTLVLVVLHWRGLL